MSSLYIFHYLHHVVLSLSTMSLIHSSYLNMITKMEIYSLHLSRQPGDPGVDSGEARDSAPVTEGDHPNQEEAV